MEVSRRYKGLLILLLDQSSHAGKLDAAARANKLLYDLCTRCMEAGGVNDCFDISVIRYCADDDGAPIVGPALMGPLAERNFVSIAELFDNPGRIETATSWIADEETDDLVPFELHRPLWVEGCASGYAPLSLALLRATLVADSWLPKHPKSPPPFVMNITAGAFAGGDPEPNASKLMERSTTLGNVVLGQSIHNATVNWPDSCPDVVSCLPRLFSMSSKCLPKTLRNSIRGFSGVKASEITRLFSMNDDERMILDLIYAVTPGSRIPAYIDEDMITDEQADGAISASYIRIPEA